MAGTNTIYDRDGKIIGIFRFGVGWSRDPRIRFGEYDSSGIFDNLGNRLASLEGSKVVAESGVTLGTVEGGRIVVGGEEVGRCIGSEISAAAALAYFFGGFELPPYNKSLQQTPSSGAAEL